MNPQTTLRVHLEPKTTIYGFKINSINLFLGLFWIQKCCSQFLLNAKFAFLLLQVNSYKWPKNIVNSYWYNCFTEKPRQVKGRKQYDLSPKLKGIKKAFNQMKIMYTRQSSMPCFYHYKIVSVRLWWLRSWIHVMIVLLARRKVQVNLEISHVLSVTTFRFINVFPWWKCCFSYYHECLVLKVFVLFKWYQHLTWHLNFKIWTWSFCIIFKYWWDYFLTMLLLCFNDVSWVTLPFYGLDLQTSFSPSCIYPSYSLHFLFY